MFFALDFFFKKRFSKLSKRLDNFEELQRKELKKIIRLNNNCAYLKSFGVNNLDDFDKLPISVYEDFEDQINELIHTGHFTLSSEKIIACSKSSGTTSFSKLIPQSKKNIQFNYKAGFDLLSSYIYHYPKSKITAGKNFSLTGSYEQKNGLIIGDISALIAYYLPSIFYFFRVPSKEIALVQDWDKKLDQLIAELISSDIRWIAGVPSWIKLIIERIERQSNKSILEVWPNLEVFFYGGTDISIFKKQFDILFENKVIYWQTYNASEGFFAIQNNSFTSDMALMPDYGIYFEFLNIKSGKMEYSRDLKIGAQYELIVTNSCGLWRYKMGDIIEITDKKPLKIKIVGRTKHFINAFGEELMIHNVEKALEILNKEMNFELIHFTVAPKIDSEKRGFHQWLVEFAKLPESLEDFEKNLDQIIQYLNSDYKAKRSNNLIMKNLKVNLAQKGQFEKWLRSKKKLNAQAKIPKLCNNSIVYNEIVSIQ